MEIEALIKTIQNEIRKGNEEFFGYAWREKLNELGEFLQEESRFSKLVDWINKELEQTSTLKNIFCPADKDEKTTISMVAAYEDLMKKMAILIHCKELLLDSRTTTKMRENIEYTICKLYKIKYSEYLKIYV